jgi:hypothetical protein
MYESFIPISISKMYLLNNNPKLSLDQYQDHLCMKVLKSIEFPRPSWYQLFFFKKYLMWGPGLYVQKTIERSTWVNISVGQFPIGSQVQFLTHGSARKIFCWNQIMLLDYIHNEKHLYEQQGFISTAFR